MTWNETVAIRLWPPPPLRFLSYYGRSLCPHLLAIPFSRLSLRTVIRSRHPSDNPFALKTLYRHSFYTLFCFVLLFFIPSISDIFCFVSGDEGGGGVLVILCRFIYICYTSPPPPPKGLKKMLAELWKREKVWNMENKLKRFSSLLFFSITIILASFNDSSAVGLLRNLITRR